MQSERERLVARARKRRDNKRYDRRHRTIRQMLDPFVQAGAAACARCGELIPPGAWDLGHDDVHPHLHSGPEHTWCNRGAPQRNVTSRQW